MARPKMKFTLEEASSLVAEFSLKIKDYDFCYENLNLAPNGRWPLAEEARKALEPLSILCQEGAGYHRDPKPLPLDLPERLREWLETYVTEAGWKRVLATRRQRALARRHHRTLLDDKVFDTPYCWARLADELCLDKKELMARIPVWLWRDEAGKAAFKKFAFQMHIEQRNAGMELLTEVLELDEQTVKTAIFESVAFNSDRERELFRAAALAGKPKLLQLSKAFKKMPAEDRLRKIAKPAVELKGKSLLEMVATGSVKKALEGLISSCDDATV